MRKLIIILTALVMVSCTLDTNIEDEHSPTGEFICPLPDDLPTPLPQSAVGTVDKPFQGDILVDKENKQNKQAGVISALWEDRVIPMYFDERWRENPEKFAVVQSALDEYRELGFTFPEVHKDSFTTSQHEDLILVKYSGVAASYIGKKGWVQEMYLPHNWNSLYSTTVHEVGHAVGLHHSHVTEMQDEWLTIHWDNIQPEKKNFFMTYEQYDEKYSDGDFNGQRQGYEYADEYDIYSIMNYGSNNFAIDHSKPTMTLKDGTWFKRGDKLSEWDKISIDRMYRCYEKNKPWFDSAERDEVNKE